VHRNRCALAAQLPGRPRRHSLLARPNANFVIETVDSLHSAKYEWRDYYPYNAELDDRNTWKLLSDYGTYGLRPAIARPLGHGLPVIEYTDTHGRYWLADLPPAFGVFPILLCTMAWGTVFAFVRYRNRSRASRSRCVACGYDLRATPHCCPE